MFGMTAYYKQTGEKWHTNIFCRYWEFGKCCLAVRA